MLLAASLALAGEMAVTIDDLPWNAGVPAGVDKREATARIVAALVARGVPAVAFVNCDRVANPGVLKPWMDAGFELGNHSASHMDLSTRPLAAWTEDVRRCDARLREWQGTVRWFRFPYLHQGETAQKRDGAYAAITEMGERVAQVSIDNHEWKLAADYGATADPAKHAEIGARYVEHMAQASSHFAELARAKTGHDVRHVLLLHANALAADHLGAVLDRLAADGWRWVTLEAAMSDPVYALPDTWASPNGPSWLHRIDPQLPNELAWERGNAGW